MSTGLYIGKEDCFTKKRNLSPIRNCLPMRVAIVHCGGHQKQKSPEGKGNRMAALATQTVNPEPVGPCQVLVALTELCLLDCLKHAVGKIDWENKNWAHRIGKDGGCCCMSGKASG